MKVNGFIVDPTYRIEDEKAYVHLYGRLEDGRSFLSIHPYSPYFYVQEADIKKAQQLTNHSITSSCLTDFRGRALAKVIAHTPKDIPALRKAFEEQAIVCYEADIRFPYRFLFDHDLYPFITIEGKERKGTTTDVVFEEPRITSAISNKENVSMATLPKLKAFSFDIETDETRLLSIAYATNDGKSGAILVRHKSHADSYEFTQIAKDEKEALTLFFNVVAEHDPDILLGWNVIDFDLAFLEERCKKHGLTLLLGRDNSPARLRIESMFLRDSKAEITGRVVLDGIHVLKSSFVRLDDYKLQTAAKELLGESKIFEGDGRFAQIKDAYVHNPQKLIDYNIKDAQLVLDILAKTDTLNLTIQRSMLTGMPIDRVNASVATLDSLYLRESLKRGKIAYCSGHTEKPEENMGGFVMDPKPGIYDYIIVCDFKSLYPSIMRTFNIDPISHIPDCTKKTSDAQVIVAPNGACFSREEGILPAIIERLWHQRDKAKQEHNVIASYAIKIHMNSLYGVLGNASCRFFSLDIANAITHFAQKFIKRTAVLVEERGYEVIYGDTDSVFINTKANNAKQAQQIGEQIARQINEVLTQEISKDYHRTNMLELEFEKIYRRFIMPYARGGGVGAKKRYAGLLLKDGKEKVDITGLEFVRRDWTELAKQFQYTILETIFNRKDPSMYIKQFAQDLRSGKHDSLLVYKKALRKNTKEYTKTTPPHVKAARIIQEKGDKITSNVITYIMTIDGPEPVGYEEHPIDYEHYIDKQLRPIADSILVFYDQTFDDLLAGNAQKSLFDY